MGDSIPVADTRTDRTSGSLAPTGQPLDLALGDDDAFFVVDTPNGERLSRGGSFTLDAAGKIVDASGNPLLGEGGEIIPPAGTIEIDASGMVRVDGKDVDRIRVETVPTDVRMAHEAGTLFIPDPNRQPQANETRNVRQGHLESSNVSSIGSLVDMISIQRNYAAVQRAMVTMDEVRGTAANQLGKPV
jgi:flagellar basal body rod protein FlgG